MRYLIIDGNSIVNRAFYGVKALTTKEGLYTNALFGFINILQHLREQCAPDAIAVAFDVHAPTFRHKLYDAYKAGRRGMPDELRAQMPLLKELLDRMGIVRIEVEGYEADDILGTLSAAVTAEGGECYLATGDRDALQLVDEHVTVLLAATRAGRSETERMTPEAVQEKYGLTPDRLIDLKALMGDSSDNIPGVAGVGEKTAVDLLKAFGSLDGLYAAVETAEMRESVRQKLIRDRDMAYLSRTLGTILRDAPIGVTPADCLPRPVDREGLAALLVRLEFFRFLEKWELDVPTPVAAAEAVPAVELCGDEALLSVLTAASADILFDGEGVFVHAGDVYARISDTAALLPLIEDPGVSKRTHDYKALCARLLPQGVTPRGFVCDTLLAAYLLNPLSSDYSLSRLCAEYGAPAPEDAPLTAFVMLADILDGRIAEQGQTALLTDIEIPLALVLADMERLGFAVDSEGIAAFGQALDGRIEAARQAVYDAVGYEFNLNSPKQLGVALFEDLGLPAGKKTKSGYSTGADVLEKLRGEYPVVEQLLTYRSLAKLRSTYCDGLLAVVGDDGRIHSSFNQTETRTGRISSAEPNLQNIPVRQELGRELRRFFHAAPGCVLLDADYSQIELRVLAHMSGDPTMTAAFQNGDDIHRITAAQVFGVPEEMVTPLMRSRAKAVNFGIVYGIGPYSLSQDIGVSFGEAKAYIDGYLRHYGAVSAFMEGLIRFATDNGYAETLFGRRRPTPELRTGNAMTRGFGERVARNTPLQGTAADIIKIAMVRVHRRLAAEGLRARLILQVHDELIVEAPAEEAERAAAILTEEMEHAVALSVPLSVDTHSGKTWYDAKG